LYFSLFFQIYFNQHIISKETQKEKINFLSSLSPDAPVSGDACFLIILKIPKNTFLLIFILL